MTRLPEIERAAAASAAARRASPRTHDVPAGLRFVALPEPQRACERAQRRRGVGRWLRGLERRASHFLARHVYPWTPGIRRGFDRFLDGPLTVSTAEIPLPGLDRRLDGVAILLITDIHAGPFVSRAALARAFDRIRTIAADVILLGGDLVTCRPEEIEELLPALGSLTAPLGRYAVLGNHDHATGDPGALADALAARGIDCLHNRAVPLGRNGATLSLAGVDDLRHGRPDLDRALHGTTDPVVLLSHHPDIAFDAARRGVALVLSGHTHGGQIAFRGFPLLVRQSRHGLDAGRYRAGCAEVVVSRGLGAVGLPLRVGSPIEVVRVTVRCPDR